MDKRRKLTDEKMDQIRRLIKQGRTLDTIARLFNISTTTVHRIKDAQSRGEVKLKRSSLFSCMNLIKTGLPFRRVCWPEKLYYYYDLGEHWFVQVNNESGCEIILYTMDLSLEDLMAKDWVVLTWETVNEQRHNSETSVFAPDARQEDTS